MHRHEADAVAALFEHRRLARFGKAILVQRPDEAAKRQTVGDVVTPRQFGDVEHVGQGLFAARPQHEAGMRAGGLEQRRHRLGHGHAIAPAMQTGEDSSAAAMAARSAPSDAGAGIGSVDDRPSGAGTLNGCRRP